MVHSGGVYGQDQDDTLAAHERERKLVSRTAHMPEMVEENGERNEWKIQQQQQQ